VGKVEKIYIIIGKKFHKRNGFDLKKKHIDRINRMVRMFVDLFPEKKRSNAIAFGEKNPKNPVNPV
jgi:hypothetical protein